MLKVNDIRAQAAVRNFDFTEKLAEYGFKVGTRADLDAAKALVAEMVVDADTIMTSRQTHMQAVDQIPYRKRILFRGEEVKFAGELDVFTNGELSTRLDRVFAKTAEQPVPNRPDIKVIAQRVVEQLADVVKRDGFTLIGIEQTADGTPSRVVYRDPEFAAQAAEREGKSDIANLDAVTRALRDEDAKRLDVSAEQMGLRQGVSAEQIVALRGVAKEVIEQGVRDIRRRIQTLKDSGVSVYNNSSFSFGECYVSEYLDKRLAQWWFGYRIQHPVLIEAFNDNTIRHALFKRFPGFESLVYTESFIRCVRQKFIERLRSEPGLPLAAVARHTYENKLTVVLVSPQAAARATSGPLQRLLGREVREVAALPKPVELPKVGPITPPPSILAGKGTIA